jgi:16S rRNA G527 N7-methylase RsmG
MVESRARKGAFLREAVRVLQLPRTKVLTVRFEDLRLDREVDLVTIRAVRVDEELNKLLQTWLRPQASILGFGVAPTEPWVAGRSRELPDGSLLRELRVE